EPRLFIHLITQTQFSADGNIDLKNAKNFSAGYTVGVESKVWESENRSANLSMGASVEQNFARVRGHMFKSKPGITLGASFKVKF
ncbi:hypothetical protein NPIL_424771, partial [Nephila pilipes]